MSRQVHFVVYVDLDSGDVTRDDDTLSARFEEGDVWTGEDNPQRGWRHSTPEEFRWATEILLAKGIDS